MLLHVFIDTNQSSGDLLSHICFEGKTREEVNQRFLDWVRGFTDAGGRLVILELAWTD